MKVATATYTLIVLFFVFGTAFFAHQEGHTYLDAAYFSAMTMFTIGFGDVSCRTPLGKAVNVVFAIIAPGLTAVLIADVAVTVTNMPAGKRRERSAVVMSLAFALLFGGTVGFTMIEGLELLDALYLCAAIVSTVGYGDPVPTSDSGKLFAIVFAALANGVFANVSALMATTLSAMMQRVGGTKLV